MDKLRLFILLCILVPAAAAEDRMPSLAVIVNPDNPIGSLTQRQLVDLYMGRTGQFPDGSTVIRLDQEAESHERKSFYRKLTGKSTAEISAYWARLLFTGRAKPPVVMSDDRAVIKAVQTNRNAIGYIAVDSKDDSVRVVMHVE